MRRAFGIVLGLVLVFSALATTQPSQALTCLGQCNSQRTACNATCNSDPNCLANCADQWEACRCNVCHSCL